MLHHKIFRATNPRLFLSLNLLWNPHRSLFHLLPRKGKFRAVEKVKRKISAKRNKRSKVATPELDVEGPRVEVDLPPRVRLLQDQQTNVDIMRQLLSEADAETLGQGPLQSRLGDLLWDGLKINVRAMGLIYRTTGRVAEQKVRINELEDINKELKKKDNAREEKLLDIERKFKDVKSSAEGFDEAQGKIKTLEAENSALGTQILDAFKKATLKARYDLLKEQGLLVDAEVDEEIELYEDTLDDAGCSSSAPAKTLPTSNVQWPSGDVPASNDQGPSGDVPPVIPDPSEDRKTRQLMARIDVQAMCSYFRVNTWHVFV
ncbi:hypothetical protein TIFTF001_035771 [Ficus carica]|uniref:Uncharacterized protein n=1 Tax=Ficus carica TaxID=3494 RepID=A0AA88JAF8_FICCA|nr:hypothetical protein TIFTF001_035771 [Ficus carica]